jgi:hypothetical protein
MTLSRDKKSVIRSRIAEALPLFHFRRIETLFYLDERGHEVTEYADARGVLISSRRLGVTLSGGNRVVNNSEIWLYPDGSLHEYLDAATWETFEGGCTQRSYVGPAQEDRITIDDLEEQIEFHSAPDWEDDNGSDFDYC